MGTIPQKIISLAEMKQAFSFSDSVTEVYEEGMTTPIGFRAPFWADVECERSLVFSWQNQVTMSGPGFAKSPMHFMRDTFGALNARFGTTFRDVTFWMLPGTYVDRSDRPIGEFNVTDFAAATDIFTYGLWQADHPPRAHGLESQFGRKYGAKAFARITPEQLNANYGQDYWLLPIESIGTQLLSNLRQQEKCLKRKEHEDWKLYRLKCRLCRRSICKLVAPLKSKGILLDCSDEERATISSLDGARTRTIWYTEEWLEILQHCLQNGCPLRTGLFDQAELIALELPQAVND